MRSLLRATLLLGLAMPLAAQTARSTLTLAEALEIAKKNNPTYLQSVTGRTRASAALRPGPCRTPSVWPTFDLQIQPRFGKGSPRTSNMRESG